MDGNPGKSNNSLHHLYSVSQAEVLLSFFPVACCLLPVACCPEFCTSPVWELLYDRFLAQIGKTGESRYWDKSS
ncbi:MAG: hypothetical protein F6K18_21175 [Okeania sp. SIO2C2]|uniref:hypothetical protein n=1 Tax=Okeania sp. SIO2C2 TaxID=2607787 RepID=UPI0013B6CDF8|nr:hypothetical protein [Okeania sp. SIO2C2]NEP89140.1 hypothetical protein [Okeania sp. SIO2C2]